MSEDRIHRALSHDGTEIGARMHGQGPPLILVHGGVGNGETSWRFLVPLLSRHFTCYCMSLRGRGLSMENPDQSTGRLEDDIIAMADSIGEPILLMGHSSGGALALGAATRAAHVVAIAAYEPALPELSEEIRGRYADAFARMRDAAAEGRLTDAATIALEDCALANDDELATMANAGVAELLALNVPVHVRDHQFVDYRLLDSPSLERLTMPILLLHGERSHPFYTDVVRHLAEQLPAVHVRRIVGAGHMGPLLASGAVAEEVIHFFTQERVPA